MNPDPTIRLVTVFETADPGLAAVAKSLLDDAGIDHTIRGETQANVFGWGTRMSPGVGVPAFQVREQDAARATELLARLEG
jgi:hypothetical protein